MKTDRRNDLVLTVAESIAHMLIAFVFCALRSVSIIASWQRRCRWTCIHRIYRGARAVSTADISFRHAGIAALASHCRQHAR